MVETKNLKYDLVIIYLLELYLLLLICKRLYLALYNWQSLAKRPTRIATNHLANELHFYSLDFLVGI